ncbi:MAG: DNA polymerase III subunit epsilon [Hyphomicrobiales bacterium]|nr:DNA polymerase III subunit epsilon [Hyphomicrobiales bacterium]
MREIVLDTETTGLEPADGHRIIEIGCVELLNHVPTGRTYQCYVNPERPVPEAAFAVHGISDDFLQDKPKFADIASVFMTFLGNSPLVIHNAAFDLKFINAELERVGQAVLEKERAIDTLLMARQKFPGSPASLDALCKRFEIDLSDRAYHGALKDTQLLAQVYLELLGGRQPGLELITAASSARANANRQPRTPLLIEPTEAERDAHTALLMRLKDPLWLRSDKHLNGAGQQART